MIRVELNQDFNDLSMCGMGGAPYKCCYIRNNLVVQVSECTDRVVISLVNISTDEVIRTNNIDNILSQAQVIDVVHWGTVVYISLIDGSEIKMVGVSEDLTGWVSWLGAVENTGIGSDGKHKTLVTDGGYLTYYENAVITGKDNTHIMKTTTLRSCIGFGIGIYEEPILLWKGSDGKITAEGYYTSAMTFEENYTGLDVVGTSLTRDFPEPNSIHIYIFDSEYNLYRYIHDNTNREFILNIPKNTNYTGRTFIGAVYTKGDAYYDYMLHFFVQCYDSRGTYLEVISVNPSSREWLVKYIYPFESPSINCPLTIDASYYGEANRHIFKIYSIKKLTT